MSRVALSDGSIAKSAGSAGELFAPGSTRVSEDDLELHVRRLPLGAASLFVLSDASPAWPLGGALCVACVSGALRVSGNLTRLGSPVASADGTTVERLDIAPLPPVGGGALPGSTCNAQIIHRDLPQSGGLNFTSTSALLFQQVGCRASGGPGPGGARRPPLGPPSRPLPLLATAGSLGSRGAHRRLPRGGRLLVWPAWSAGSTPTGEPPSGPPLEALILPPLRIRG